MGNNKKFKSTFTTHHNAPAWILEEVKSDEVKDKAPENEKLNQLLHQLAMSNQPGMTLEWNDEEGSGSGQNWKFRTPTKKESKILPDKITVIVDSDSDDDVVEILSGPPVKYYLPDGKPVYYFQDPETGHKYFDECECEACYEDCLLNNDGISPQEFKEIYARENALKKVKQNEEVEEPSQPALEGPSSKPSI